MRSIALLSAQALLLMESHGFVAHVGGSIVVFDGNIVLLAVVVLVVLVGRVCCCGNVLFGTGLKNTSVGVVGFFVRSI